MADQPLITHSLREIELYLRATPCPSCGRGPLIAAIPSDTDHVREHAEPAPPDDRLTLQVEAECKACGATAPKRFSVPRGACTLGSTLGEAINESVEPSRLLDVGQWIVLARLLLEDAQREPDRVLARNLRIESGRCLEEAVKFFDDAENDLPPAGAFFCDASRLRFRQAPEQFSRRRLIEMRSRLPNPYPPAKRTGGTR